MKKILLLFLSFLASLALASCKTTSGNYPIFIQKQFPPIKENIQVHIGGGCPHGEEYVGNGTFRTEQHVSHYSIPSDLADDIRAMGGNKIVIRNLRQDYLEKVRQIPIYRTVKTGNMYIESITGYNTQRYWVNEYTGSFDIYRCEAFLKKNSGSGTDVKGQKGPGNKTKAGKRRG